MPRNRRTLRNPLLQCRAYDPCNIFLSRAEWPKSLTPAPSTSYFPSASVQPAPPSRPPPHSPPRSPSRRGSHVFDTTAQAFALKIRRGCRKSPADHQARIAEPQPGELHARATEPPLEHSAPKTPLATRVASLPLVRATVGRQVVPALACLQRPRVGVKIDR